MRIGVCATPRGTTANPAAMRAAALAAEQLGYDSIWVGDEAGGLDPVVVLGGAAALTSRVRLGVSRLAVGHSAPAALARAFRTLTIMSGGRFTAALDVDDRETFSALTAYLGETRPQVLIATNGLPSPTAIGLLASVDGWHPRGVPVAELGPVWSEIRRDGQLLVVRADVVVTDRSPAPDRVAYTGDIEQIADDLVATRRAGADEIVLALRDDLGFDAALDTFARIAEAVEERTRASSPTFGP